MNRGKSISRSNESFDGDLSAFNNHSDKNMIICESWLNKKGKIHKAMQLRYVIAYTTRKIAYFRKADDKLPAGYIDLSAVSTINIYLPKNNNKNKKKNKNHAKHVSFDDFEEMKSFDEMKVNKNKIRSWSVGLKDISLKGDNFGFELVTPARKWVFGCSDGAIFEKWIGVLRELCFGSLLHNGYLRKLGDKYKTWRRRYFIIYDLNEIRYFEDDTLVKEKGKIELNCVTKIRSTDSNEYHYKNCIELHTAKRVWVLATESNKERQIWINGIKSIMKEYERTFRCTYNGFLSLYNPLTFRWNKYYFAVESNHRTGENKLCCFDNQITFKQLQAITCYGDMEYDLVCKKRIHKIISLNELVNVLIIPIFEFKQVNFECKDDMTELQSIFTIKLDGAQYYLCPHPNNNRTAQKWVNIIKNLKCSQRQNMYNKLVKMGYKSSYIQSALVQYENLNEKNRYNFNEIQQMINRMAKPETGSSSSQSPTSPTSPMYKQPLTPLNESCITYNKILNNNNYLSWSNNDILLWFKSLDNGLIVSKYPSILNELRKLNINGRQLKQLNDINFQQLGIDDELHRALVMEALSELE